VSETKPIPIIAGPTGAGKTGVALKLVEQFPVEIVSADSRQIIKRLDIGTAKPTPKERRKVSFHLLDLIEPGERYTAYRFIDDANRAIESILQKEHIPLLVGGTGLYLRALSEGVVEISADNMEVRQRLEKEMQQLGPEKMYQRLMEIDPQEAAKLHPGNKVRVIRALEMYYLTGKPKSALLAAGSHKKSEYPFRYFCLIPQRQALYTAIEQRVDDMMVRGWLEEVQRLCRDGWRERIRKANVIGYNELLDYLDGIVSLDEAVSRIKQNTRRYAKRQITWFRHQVKGTFYNSATDLLQDLQHFLSRRRI
jgi:tRNA dimethylallyltransferase